jgi:hypothetical protein
MNTERVSINLSKAKTLYHNRYQKKLKEHIYLSRATWSNAGSSALFRDFGVCSSCRGYRVPSTPRTLSTCDDILNVYGCSDQ